MQDLFSPIAIAAPDGESWYRIELDPCEPFLHDHRPGGAPLFGTVMQLEAAAAAARVCAGGDSIWGWSIDEVCVGSPYILHDESTEHSVTVSVRRSSCAPAIDLRCTVLTPSRRRKHLIHLEAMFRSKPTLCAPTFHKLPPALGDDTHVPGALVYELFFHGPSFQVIASARWNHSTMACRLASPLPPSHLRAHISQAAPRLIEFGLQTAGLLELATTGRMMIPRSIRRIERLVDVDVNSGEPLYALATFNGSLEGIDIDIVDDRGDPAMRILGYRTEPLPFGTDQAGCAELAARLRATASAVG